MTSLGAMSVCVGISLALSIILIFAIAAPLRAFIQRACPSPEAVNFWSRFTLVMLFLAPLFCCLVWGLPAGELLKKVDLGLLIQRAVTSSLVGAFLVMLGIGIWVSAMGGRQPPPPPARRRSLSDDERVA
jgi:hypothetical protein